MRCVMVWKLILLYAMFLLQTNKLHVFQIDAKGEV